MVADNKSIVRLLKNAVREYIKDESVDLIYLDPPFKSDQSYNVIFREKNGSQSRAQIKVFEDTWTWDLTAEETCQEIIEDCPKKLADLMIAMEKFLGQPGQLKAQRRSRPRTLRTGCASYRPQCSSHRATHI